MVLKKRGQVLFYTFMMGILIIVLAMAIAPTLNTVVQDARGNTTDTNLGMDCQNESITDYQKSQCILVDLVTPYFFFGLIGIALLVIGAKVILGE